jgi:DNA-binding NarL/FixJ family response regulator
MTDSEGSDNLNSIASTAATLEGEIRRAPLVSLTARQRDVLKSLAMGFTCEEIAVELGITARTVRAHSDALRAKLGVARKRQIPMAYRALTGDDPLSPKA